MSWGFFNEAAVFVRRGSGVFLRWYKVFGHITFWPQGLFSSSRQDITDHKVVFYFWPQGRLFV